MTTNRYDEFLDTLVPMELESPRVKILLYGDSGVGKTVLATTLGEKILYIDAVEGWVSLLNHPEFLKKCTRVKYKALSQLDTMAEMFLAGKLNFDTIVIDEASAIATFDLDTVLKARSAKDISKDPNIPTQPDFFANTERCRRTFQTILKLPVDVILVAHLREDKDERTGIIQKRPAFSPKLRQTLEQSCHLVTYMTAQEDKEGDYVRKIQTMPSRGITAKSRIGGLDRVVTNPNFAELLSGWQEVENKSETVVVPDGPITEELSDVPEFTYGE